MKNQIIRSPIHTGSRFYPNESSIFGIGINSAGKQVTADTALQLSAVWACVRLISGTVASLPLDFYLMNEKDSLSRITNDHEVVELLKNSPNHHQTPFAFFEFLVASLLLNGNAYFEKHFSKTGKLVALNLINPSTVSVERKENGRYEYHFYDNGVQVKLSEEYIWHVRGFGTDGFFGISPIRMGAQIFGTAIAANEAAGKTFLSGLSASGMLIHENGVLTDTQREQLRSNVEQFSGSSNSGKIMVLEAGLKYQSININPETAQLLQSRQYSVEEICRWFQVPPAIIGNGANLGSSTEQLFQFFVTLCLLPILKNLEQSIKKGLFSRAESRNISVKFNVDGLLRSDAKARSEYLSKMVNNGIMTRNEAREKENLPAVEGGDELTIQAALIKAKDVGVNFNTGIDDEKTEV